jgi:hypothetical protein
VFTHSGPTHLKYVVLLNALAAVIPASMVKGRANDPLLHASWYTFEQHSAALVVPAAAILGTALIYFLLRHNLRSWWMFLLSGSFIAMFPGMFYLIAAPLNDQILTTAVAMIIVGLVWGALIGVVTYAVVRKSTRAPDPNQRLERPVKPNSDAP